MKVCFIKQHFLWKRFPNGTSSLKLEYWGNGGDLTVKILIGGTKEWSAHLNIFHENRDRIAISLWHFVCVKGIVGLNLIHCPQSYINSFLKSRLKRENWMTQARYSSSTPFLVWSCKGGAQQEESEIDNFSSIYSDGFYIRSPWASEMNLNPNRCTSQGTSLRVQLQKLRKVTFFYSISVDERRYLIVPISFLSIVAACSVFIIQVTGRNPWLDY